jgi:hypothetical protein
MIDKFGKQYFSCNAFPTYFTDKHRTLQTTGEGATNIRIGNPQSPPQSFNIKYDEIIFIIIIIIYT